MKLKHLTKFSLIVLVLSTSAWGDRPDGRPGMTKAEADRAYAKHDKASAQAAENARHKAFNDRLAAARERTNQGYIDLQEKRQPGFRAKVEENRRKQERYRRELMGVNNAGLSN